MTRPMDFSDTEEQVRPDSRRFPLLQEKHQTMRFRVLTGLLLTVLLVLVSITEGRAQTISTALLEGAVRDEAGLLLSDVVISVVSESGGPTRSVVTTHEGI